MLCMHAYSVRVNGEFILVLPPEEVVRIICPRGLIANTEGNVLNMHAQKRFFGGQSYSLSYSSKSSCYKTELLRIF